jgi:flagellar biosynthesis protein FliP
MLLFFSILVTSIHLAACILSLTTYFSDFPLYISHLRTFYATAQPPARALAGLTWFLLVADLAIVIFVVQLLVFHVYLMHTNQTTFEYITAKVGVKAPPQGEVEMQD